MRAEIGAGLHNRFDFKLIDKDGNVKQEAVAHNLVTNVYYNSLNKDEPVQFSYIQVGTGTGTPAVTDEVLFTWLASKATGFLNTMVSYLNTNQFMMQNEITFTEAEAVGDITEIGVHRQTGGNARYLYTHAMITDAEGHVISIHKTDTDRLLVTVTLYLNITLPSFMLPYKGISFWNMSMYADQGTNSVSTGGNIFPCVERLLGLPTSSAYTWRSRQDGFIRCCLSPGCPNGYSTSSQETQTTLKVDSQNYLTPTGVRLVNSTRILSSQNNLPSTYQIYGFMCSVGYIPITSDIFPPLELTLTQVADGSQTGFNFGVPELMSTVKVYINDVLQPANSYTWNAIDYTNSFQAWETSRSDKVIETPALLNHNTTNPSHISTPIFNYSLISNNPILSRNFITYDFGSAQTMTRAYKPDINKQYTEWSYSNDKTNWTTLVLPSTADRYYDLPSPISARYWKYSGLGSSNGPWANNWTPRVPILCNFRNQLEFNTAPPANAVIKIEAKSAYPIKNENWLVDQFVLDFTVSRG